MDKTPSGPEPTMPRELLSSEIFIKTLADFVDKKHVHGMVDDQRHMLSRFEKTNEMLLNFNVLSDNRYGASVQEFKKHTLLLTDMKKDLDSIFKRIRNLKQTLSKQYPTAFTACGDVYDVLETEEEDSIAVSIPVPRSPAQQKIEDDNTELKNGIEDEDKSGLSESKSGEEEIRTCSDSKELPSDKTNS